MTISGFTDITAPLSVLASFMYFQILGRYWDIKTFVNHLRKTKQKWFCFIDSMDHISCKSCTTHCLFAVLLRFYYCGFKRLHWLCATWSSQNRIDAILPCMCYVLGAFDIAVAKYILCYIFALCDWSKPNEALNVETQKIILCFCPLFGIYIWIMLLMDMCSN